jgi:hypothetical protein
MSLHFGITLPQGMWMDLLGITDPVEAYETMTRAAQTAEACNVRKWIGGCYGCSFQANPA